jgi:tetratricopeptide (TPR) repeat protein
MNHTILTLLLCFALGATRQLIAQDFYLPVSTSSAEAKAAYRSASELASNIHMDSARQEMDKALVADPDFFMAYAYTVQVLAGKEEKPAMIERALAIDPSRFTKAEQIMRRYLSDLQEDPKAMPTDRMRSLVNHYGKTPEAYQWAYLHAAYTEKNLEAAFAYARQLIELAPDYPPVYNSMGYFHMQQEEMEIAKTYFDKYLALAPEEANAYDSMGEYLAVTKNYCESANYYAQAAERGMEGAWERAQQSLKMLSGMGHVASGTQLLPNPTNVALVKKLYEAFSEGNIPAVIGALDAQVVWNEAEGNSLADGNPYIGPDAVLNGVFARIGTEYEYLRLKDIKLHAMADNQVLATLRYHAKLVDHPTLIDAQAAHLWTIQDGKVTAFQQYVDTRQLAEAAAKK